MSRFFRSASDSESETDSSDNESFISDEELSDNEADSSEDEGNKQQDDQPKKSRFLKGNGDDSDDDSDEEFGRKRQVKSQKDKRIEEMQSCVKAIENGQKNSDWTRITTEFDKLSVSVTRATTGFDSIRVPSFYIKTLADTDDFLQDTLQKEKAAKKKMSAGNNKAVNAMRQKLKKLTKQYETEIAEYKKDPEAYMEEEEEEDVPLPVLKPGFLKKEVTPATEDEAADDGFTSVGKSGKAVVEVTNETLLTKLRETLENRGKKNTDREEQLSVLEILLQKSKSPFQKISVLLALISSRFDINLSMVEYMDVKLWKSVEKELNLLLGVLEANPAFVVREDADELENEDKDVTPAAGETVQIRGSIVSYAERLDDEFTRSLQHIDPHATDYMDRLRDEPSLYAILVRTQCYFEKHEMKENISRVLIRRLEHLYYKPDQVIRSIEKVTKDVLPNYVSSKITHSEEPTQLIHQTCTYLYKQNVSVLRTRAMLCHIYHFALHKDFHTARDMLLMSHLQESIHQADISTQILFNRTTVQIGLCAFRDGLIKEAHAALQEIQGSGRVKELLAQGIQTPRYGQQPTLETDQLERQRQLPFHMHINLELLECVFLTCSMLLEIPAQAQAGPNNKKFISRPFRRLLDYNERQAFSGPPENTRDHIMSAAKALASGEWERAKDFILAIKVWDLMPETQDIKDMLVRKIQEEGLRTYLFTYASYYSTLGLSQLSTMFDLPVSNVSAIVAKMIWSEELSASLDQVSQCVVLHQVELSRLQVLSLQFSEKAANLVDQNERLAGVGRDNSKSHN
ncbi:eukaryotic translation initiation factor 3 subunit 8 N-terminus-domain-containing protein [Spinellus fusiger]|nr:eukaryotic translation initiation factor 3 subunit 8 N-terminus-domain-containing protein [Spinellus fusiger]